MRIMLMEKVCTTDTGTTRVVWSQKDGFVIESDQRRGGMQTLPIDPASMDAIVAMWPSFRERAKADAPATSAAQVTPSPPASKAGPAATNSPSSRSAPPTPPGRLL